MDIRSIPVERINPAPYNPRKQLRPGDPEYEKLKRSLEEFGYVDPLIWNARTGNLVGGHQRFAILVAGGARELDVSVVDLDLDREKALNVALNKISGEWEEGALRSLLADLDAAGFDTTLSGFDEGELEALLAEADPTAQDDDFDPEAAAEEIADPITKAGDIWLLGRHRLMCGDSTRLEDVGRLMSGRFADMVFTDPPYNVAYVGKTDDELTIMNDNMALDDFRRFLVSAFSAMYAYTKPGGPIYVCHADVGGIAFRQAFMDAGWLFKQCLIWVKNGFVLGRQDYHWQHEPILYGWKPGAAHFWYGDRDKGTVIDDNVNISGLKRDELRQLVKDLRNALPTTVIREDRPHVNDVHPTMKPPSLVGRFVVNSSDRRGVVQDLFGGSGSTLVACEQLDRACFTMELDPKYCDVIVRRWQNLTGRQAVREADGVLYDQLTA